MIDLGLFSKRVKECRENAGLTQRQLASLIGTSAANINRYEKGSHGAGSDALQEMANVFNINPVWLMGAQVDKYMHDIIPAKKIPIVGTIAAGHPMIAEENITGYEWVPKNDGADFCLKVKGNSMSGIRIMDGDTVFIRKQEDVEHREIAAVIIDNQEATIKRVLKINGTIILHPENPEYEDIVFAKKDAKEIKIIGKVLSFKSEVR